MLAIATYCTKSYCYALHAQMPLTVAALRRAGVKDAVFIMSGDDSKEVAAAFKDYEKHLKDMAIPCHLVIARKVADNGGAPHKKDSNLVIARMQHAAWDKARALGADLLWSLEADILPEPKTLRCMMDVLAFDGGWYDVCMATYPNQGFLGGRGTPQRWILPNIFPDEHELTEEVKARLETKKKREAELTEKKEKYSEDDLAEWRALDEAIEQCPAKGNVYKLNGERWRMRGWLDNAYPGIGRGAVLPTDWTGLGCTLMSRRALDLAHFTGFEGGCTQDLWLCWRVWNPAHLHLGVTTHALCSHVKWRTIPAVEAKPATDTTPEIIALAEKRELIIHFARHELGGECDGHLRVETRPWDGL